MDDRARILKKYQVPNGFVRYINGPSKKLKNLAWPVLGPAKEGPSKGLGPCLACLARRMALAWPYTENFTLGPRKGHKCGTFIRIYVPRASLHFNGPLLACQCTEMDQNGAIYVPIVYHQCTVIMDELGPINGPKQKKAGSGSGSGYFFS